MDSSNSNKLMAGYHKTQEKQQREYKYKHELN